MWNGGPPLTETSNVLHFSSRTQSSHTDDRQLGAIVGDSGLVMLALAPLAIPVLTLGALASLVIGVEDLPLILTLAFLLLPVPVGVSATIVLATVAMVVPNGILGAAAGLVDRVEDLALVLTLADILLAIPVCISAAIMLACVMLVIPNGILGTGA